MQNNIGQITSYTKAARFRFFDGIFSNVFPESWMNLTYYVLDFIVILVVELSLLA